MKNKRLCLFLLVLFGVTGPLFPKVTLKQAIDRAWTLSPAVERQLLAEETTRVGWDHARRQRYFRVDGSGYYRFSSDTVQVRARDFPLQTGDTTIPGDTLLLSGPHDTYDLKLTLFQPIFTGGAINQAVRMEEIRQALEKRRTEMVKNDLAGQVKSSYLTYRFLLAKRDSLNWLLESLGLHLKKTEAYFREKLVRRSDLLETQNKMDEVRISMEEVSQQIEQERIAFRTLCGLDPEEVDPSGLEPAGTHDDSLAFFFKSHPLLQAFKEQERLVEAGRKAAAAARLPQLAGYYELHYGNPGVNFFEKEWKLYVSAGLTLSVPLINRSQSDRDLTLSVLEQKKLESGREAFVQETEKGLKQVYQLKKTLVAKQGLTASLIRNAEEDAQLKESLYREGQISNLDYLAAVVMREKYRSLMAELDVQQKLADVRIQFLIAQTGAGQ